MFGLVHAVVFLFSALLWLLLAAWNTRAAALGFSPQGIGLLNASCYVVYILSALTLGHLGDRMGYKRPLALALLLFSPALLTGFAWERGAGLYATAGLTCLFFGFFYPCVEGLLSKMEAREGADPASTTRRFCLSWSAGNIFGMLLGPGLVQSHPAWIFLGGIALCLVGGAALWFHHREHGDGLPGRYPALPEEALPAESLPQLLSQRLAARFALFLGAIAFFGTMFLFPKILWGQGISPGQIGVLAACGNLAVFLVFLLFGHTRFWIGRPGVMAGLSATALLLFGVGFLGLPALPWGFGLLAALGGVSYALPYTFAIFYGLNTPSGDHAKQGALHEVVIGLGIGGGPLLGGGLLSWAGDWRILGAVAGTFGVLSLAAQLVLCRVRQAQAERVKL